MTPVFADSHERHVPVPAFQCKVLSTIDNNGALQPRAGLQDNGRSDGPFGHCQGSALCGHVDSGKPLVNAWGQAGLIYDRSDLMPENLGDARIENAGFRNEPSEARITFFPTAPAYLCSVSPPVWSSPIGPSMRPVARVPADQTNRTLRSIVLITESIFPFNTCLARLSVKPSATWNGTCEGNDSA